MHLLPSHWETARLRMSDSRHDESTRLNDIFNACALHVAPWDPTFVPQTEEPVIDLISLSMEPERDSRGIFRMQSIREKEGSAIIGYFHLYHGMPKPDVVFISMCVIHPDYQKQRYGSELAEGLIAQLRALGCYRAIWLNVYLKNWPALRHWMRAGFTTMLEWRGDTIHAADTHASLILECEIREK